MKSFLIILLFSTILFSQGYRIAIFDYDIREKNEYTVAKHIEINLSKSSIPIDTIAHFSGMNDQKIALTLLRELDTLQYDLIITITSDAMVPAFHGLERTSWLFTNVNNPRFFGISNMQKPGGNKSGVTYYVPVITQLAFFQEIMNNSIEKIGIIFDKEAGSRRAELGEFRNAAKSMKLKYQLELVRSKEELPTATERLLSSDVDAIIITSSDRLYNNVDLILPQCSSHNIPIFSVNKKGVANGAVASFASDYYLMVEECLIPMVVDVLENKKSPGTLPIRTLSSPNIYLNTTQAEKLGISIDDSIKSRASKTF